MPPICSVSDPSGCTLMLSVEEGLFQVFCFCDHVKGVDVKWNNFPKKKNPILTEKVYFVSK